MRHYERGSDGAKMLARIEELHSLSPTLAAIFLGERMLELLGGLCGELVLLFKDKINSSCRAARASRRTRTLPPTSTSASSIISLLMMLVDPFTRENGCLEIARHANQRVFLPANDDRHGARRGDAARSRPAGGGARRHHRLRRLGAASSRAESDRRAATLLLSHLQPDFRRRSPRRVLRSCKRELFPPEYERKAGVDYAAIGKQFNLGNPFD
jgi:hypothetical protein